MRASSPPVLFVSCFLACRVRRAPAPAEHPANYVAGKLITLNDNGAWSWFMDERAIVADGKLIVGSVRAVGDFHSGRDDPNWGNVELAVYDIAAAQRRARGAATSTSSRTTTTVPPCSRLPDGRILAVYTRHAVERKVFYRISEPHDPLAWGPVHEDRNARRGQSAVTPAATSLTRICSSLKSGRIYNFYRGFDYDPNYMFSDDQGQTWQLGGRLLKGRDGYGPYTKYASDGDETIHFVATEDHPAQLRQQPVPRLHPRRTSLRLRRHAASVR